MLSAPTEGLWTIACDWRESWPTEWHSARPGGSETVGDWTIVRGSFNACGADWQFQDSYRPQGSVVKAVRRFTWKSVQPLPKITLTVRFQSKPGKGPARRPGILYNRNPSRPRTGPLPIYATAPV